MADTVLEASELVVELAPFTALPGVQVGAGGRAELRRYLAALCAARRGQRRRRRRAGRHRLRASALRGGARAQSGGTTMWRERRTVSKYGRIKLHGNQYPVTGVPHGTVVEVRFDPYDLTQLAIYDAQGVLIETTSTSKQVTAQVPTVPEESRTKPAQVSTAARPSPRIRRRPRETRATASWIWGV